MQPLKLLACASAVTCMLSLSGVGIAGDFTVLHAFPNDSNDGGYPYEGGLVMHDGVLYGTTDVAGPNGIGVVFRINTDGTGYTLLHAFPDAAVASGDGEHPYNSTLAYSTSDQQLYGTTFEGGANGYGTVYAVDKTGANYRVVFDGFTYGAEGAYPEGSVILSQDNTTLYGMTCWKGAGSRGTVFSVGTDGQNYTVLHPFNDINYGGTAYDGDSPFGTLTLSGSTLYGMTNAGGLYDGGTLFKLPTNGSDYTVLHAFGDPAVNGDGIWPNGSVTIVGDYLYGMTYLGGDNTSGTVFRMGIENNEYMILHHFDCSTHGGRPYGSLTYAGGMLYGTTIYGNPDSYNAGTIFRIGLDGSDFTILHEFDDNGYTPYGDVLLYNGHLYGMTNRGPYPGNDAGVIFSLATPEFETIQDSYASMGLSFTGGDIDLLSKLYYDGKEGLSPSPISIDGREWSYFDYEIPGWSVGQTGIWNSGGTDYYVFYMGSGVMAPVGGGDVPEPSTLILLLPFIGFGLKKLRKGSVT